MKMRVGVVGCGAVAERYHLPALLGSSDVTVVAMVDANIDRARALAGRVNAPVATSDYMDLPGNIDLAVVAVPNAFHERVSVDLLSAGVHVLVEKPMARTAIECDRIIAAAAHSGAVIAVGHDFRHFPVARFARDLFAADVLGAVRRVDVRQGTGGRWPYASSAALSPEAGGGVLIDFGVHILDLLLWWLGDLRPVACRHDAAGGIETECELELELTGGAPVHIELSRARQLRDTFIIEGQRATLEIGVFEPAIVRLSLSSDTPALTGALPDPEFDQAPLLTVFGRQLADVVAAIRDHREPVAGAHEGRRVVALIEACYALHQPLRLPWDYPEVYASIGRTGP
jgi:predicted dehydrogenase